MGTWLASRGCVQRTRGKGREESPAHLCSPLASQPLNLHKDHRVMGKALFLEAGHPSLRPGSQHACVNHSVSPTLLRLLAFEIRVLILPEPAPLVVCEASNKTRHVNVLWKLEWAVHREPCTCTFYYYINLSCSFPGLGCISSILYNCSPPWLVSLYPLLPLGHTWALTLCHSIPPRGEHKGSLACSLCLLTLPRPVTFTLPNTGCTFPWKCLVQIPDEKTAIMFGIRVYFFQQLPLS